MTSEIRINTNWILLPEFVRFKLFLDFVLFLYCLQDIYSKKTTWKYVRSDQSSH